MYKYYGIRNQDKQFLYYGESVSNPNDTYIISSWKHKVHFRNSHFHSLLMYSTDCELMVELALEFITQVPNTLLYLVSLSPIDDSISQETLITEDLLLFIKLKS